MFYALVNDTIIMFLNEDDRDLYISRNSDATAIDDITEMQGELTIVLYSCLNCTYCIIDENVLSRSLVCSMKGGREIAWAGFGECHYFDLKAKRINNPYFIDNHCTDFFPTIAV